MKDIERLLAALAFLVACRSEPPAATTSASAGPPVTSTPTAMPWSPHPEALTLPGSRLVRALAFSEDGARIAAAFSAYAADAGRWQGEIAVWSVARRQLLVHVALPDDIAEPDALAFSKDGGLLVGGGGFSSRVWHTVLRVSPTGQVGSACAAGPPGVGRRPGPQPRGVGSMIELRDGRVVSGGRDDSIAVWSATGCDVEWPRGTACGWAESLVHVARSSESNGFLTLGETSWRGEEELPPPLGAQRWRGPPWKREAAGPPGARTGSGWLLAPNGQVVPSPAAEGRQTSAAAVSADGSCAAAASERLAWIEDQPARRRRTMELPAKTSLLAVASGCAAFAAESDHGVWLCRAGACLAP